MKLSRLIVLTVTVLGFALGGDCLHAQANLVLSLTGMERVLPSYPDTDSAFA